MKQEEVGKHFDQIASKYDYYKKNHGYYHNAIKRGLKSLIKPGTNILDWGCGTGEILAFLKPSSGVGFDISSEMIRLARHKFNKVRNLRFVDSQNQISGAFDYIIMVDVVEHLASPQKTFKDLSRFTSKNTQVVVCFVGPVWEPAIWFLGVLRPKTPEGPHKRLSKSEVVQYSRNAGLRLQKDYNFRIFPWLPISPITILIFKAS
ncbi:hypothetical protein A2115_01585 [Candidatus Woesebacteria bacterium GWA1_41_8]|uniref:Methyltransferase domain-containing protein n=1 Tax=Candidatus Woesebacteria bacterium GWA1_41_8 TaxID=1802471 RepID=A0A1F7WH77_9BACT|nr:MAG: hypothetical protein A2115_01585 [Candidatus Woesebacteria bacterium GWA1_41_8]